MWGLFNTGKCTVEETMEVINELLENGYEFIVENGNIYYRVIW